MSPGLILLFIFAYFLLLLFLGWYTGRKADAAGYFTGNHSSPWLVVAIGMIGDSLSGVTYISVPGAVVNQSFYYLQVVIGYFIGYFVITGVLLPLYYRLKLVSIYSFLGNRFGSQAGKTGSFFFILSRLLGAAGRLYLAAGVIQLFVFDAFGIPFYLSVGLIILLMLIYTLQGGIRTLVWTDAFQSLCLLAGVVFSIAFIAASLHLDFSGLVHAVASSPYADFIDSDPRSKSYFLKQILGGMFITIAMTGLDQNMMQKNLSCKSLGDARKNLITFSVIMLVVNVFFLSLGALLYVFAQTKGIDLPLKAGESVIQTDAVFPHLAMHHLGDWAGFVFILGLTAATFNSADSVLTTLTTAFYFDFLKGSESNDKRERTTRKAIHIGFALLLFILILGFKALNKQAIIDTVLTVATYTYGPLLGLFSFGIFTKRRPAAGYIPVICLLSPLICLSLNAFSKQLFNGYSFGYELLPLNGLITFAGLWILGNSQKVDSHTSS